MVKKMLINASHPEECRVAVVSDGLLEELDVQIKSREATLGNIYKGVINRIEPSLQAVFVDYGGVRNGFLSINDVHPSYFPESFEAGRKRPRIQDVFKKDDHVIVQVNKEERHTKGASLTTNISLAGRYLVLMPGTDLCGVSRKIEEEPERQKLKEILKQLKPPENMGFIIRTAGMGRSKTELARDLDYLLRLWKSIEHKVAEEAAPALLYQEHDLVIRSIREHFSPDISEILVDEKEVHKQAREFFREVMPKHENIVKLYQERRPLFNKYQLEEQIEQVYRRRINLKSGGYILIDPTEAMVSIDVNSGSATKERGVEDTAFHVNMEAAPEIARQLRLRDLGGIIVIDFIDMMHKSHKQEVERALKAVLKTDRAKTKVLRISLLGLLELSRQRLKSTLGTGEYLDCPLCSGLGRIRSPEVSALSVFRRIKSLLVKGDVTEIRAAVPEKVGEYLLNNMRAHLVELERQYSSKIAVSIKQNMPDRDITVEAIKEELIEQPHPLEAAPPVAAIQLEVAQEIEEVAAPEEDKKKSKKPGRRRRRSKRKTAPEAENGGVAAESEGEGTTIAEDFAGLEEIVSPDHESPSDLAASAVAEKETDQAQVVETSISEDPSPVVAESGMNSAEPDSQSEIPRTEEAAPSEEKPASEADKEGTSKKSDDAPRKFLLHTFLPFS
jgi:ribonuclease E